MMTDKTEELIQLLRQQMELQQRQHREEMERREPQRQDALCRYREERDNLIKLFTSHRPIQYVAREIKHVAVGAKEAENDFTSKTTIGEEVVGAKEAETKEFSSKTTRARTVPTVAMGAKEGETKVFNSNTTPGNDVYHIHSGPRTNHQRQPDSTDPEENIVRTAESYRCGMAHETTDCHQKDVKSPFSSSKGHADAVCKKRKCQHRDAVCSTKQHQHRAFMNRITKAELVKARETQHHPK